MLEQRRSYSDLIETLSLLSTTYNWYQFGVRQSTVFITHRKPTQTRRKAALTRNNTPYCSPILDLSYLDNCIPCFLFTSPTSNALLRQSTSVLNNKSAEIENTIHPYLSGHRFDTDSNTEYILQRKKSFSNSESYRKSTVPYINEEDFDDVPMKSCEIITFSDYEEEVTFEPIEKKIVRRRRTSIINLCDSDDENSDKLSTQTPTTGKRRTDHNNAVYSSRSISKSGGRLKSEIHKANRDNLALEMFHCFNQGVFQNKLPANLSITWNSRLVKTAGITLCKETISHLGVSVKEASIELSIKVNTCLFLTFV